MPSQNFYDYGKKMTDIGVQKALLQQGQVFGSTKVKQCGRPVLLTFNVMAL